MDVLVLIGRLLFVPLFLGSAVGHLTQTEGMAALAKARGVPSARLAVLGTGVMLVVGGVLVLLGVWADLGALILFLFLVSTAVLMHAFWKETDPEARQSEMVQFMKDLSLGGASLMLFAFFASVGDDLGLTITGPLFDLS